MTSKNSWSRALEPSGRGRGHVCWSEPTALYASLSIPVGPLHPLPICWVIATSLRKHNLLSGVKVLYLEPCVGHCLEAAPLFITFPLRLEIWIAFVAPFLPAFRDAIDPTSAFEGKGATEVGSEWKRGSAFLGIGSVQPGGGKDPSGGLQAGGGPLV